jgi:hypothetical protein
MEHESVPVFIALGRGSVTIDLDTPAPADEIEFRLTSGDAGRVGVNGWQNDREDQNYYSKSKTGKRKAERFQSGGELDKISLQKLKTERAEKGSRQNYLDLLDSIGAQRNLATD